MMAEHLKNRVSFWCLLALLAGAAPGGFAAEGDVVGGAPGVAPAPPAAPIAPMPGALPGLPTIPEAPTAFPSVSPSTPVGDSGSLMTMLPTLQVPSVDTTAGLASLTDVTTETEEGADAVTATVAALSGGTIQNYAFLFRGDDEGEVVRDRYGQEEAERVVAAEVTRLAEQFQTAGGGQPQQGQDPLSGGQWDFYYQQLEMYSQYVREKVLVGRDSGEEPLTEPAYDTANYLQERLDLKAEYDQEAIRLSNQQFNENLDFYDRLQDREDRRRAYYEWLAEVKRRIDESAELWGRKVNGKRWVPVDQATRTDDWYYGTNFAAEGGVEVVIDGRRYLLSRDQLRKVPPDTLNVMSTNLTPYDIVARDGNMKTADRERMMQLMAPDGAGDIPGTIEILP